MNAIRKPNGEVKGYLRETLNGQMLITPGGRVLGYYNNTTNQTTDPGGRVIGFGNLLLTLLEE